MNHEPDFYGETERLRQQVEELKGELTICQSMYEAVNEIEIPALRKENEELKSEIKSLEWSEKCLAEQVTALKSELIKKEAEAGEMREAFERILIFEISPQEYDIIEVWKIARDALSLDVGKDFLKRYEAMSKVCEAAKRLNFAPSWVIQELSEALEALDAIRAEEK